MKTNGEKYFTIAALLAMSFFPRVTEAAKITSCPFTISSPGSNKVVGNLTATGSNNCITVTADDVTIDLDGSTITGGNVFGSGSAVTDNGAARKGIRVINGTIKNFGYAGLDLNSTNGCVVEQTRFEFNGSFGVLCSNGAIVRDNAVTGSSEGIQVGAGSVVTGNVLNGNTHGISFASASNVIGNTVIGSTFGFGLFEQASPLATGSTVVNNSVQDHATGLQVNCPTNVLGNTLTGNGTSNFTIFSGVGCNVEHNVGAP